MSAENLAIQCGFLAAVQAGDLETLRRLLHPEFEMRQSPALPYGGFYAGPDGFLDFIARFMAMLDVETLDSVETFVGPSGALVGEVVIRATLKETGARIDTTLLEKWDFEQGQVRRITPHYFDAAFR